MARDSGLGRESLYKALAPGGKPRYDTLLKVIHALRMTGERELPSRRVGVFVMDELRKLDQVAYVRFASVYRKFEDVADFREEIERLERDLPGLATEELPLIDEPAPGKKR